VTSNNDYGIRLTYSSNNSISGNNITNNNGGIYLYSSSGNSISGNNITSNNYGGIWLYSSSNYNSISGSNITSNNDYGIRLTYSSNNSISGNNITNNYGGIRLTISSNYNSISGNNITGGAYGVYLHQSSNNTISENNIKNNSYEGVYLYQSSNNTFSGNNIANNGRYGVWLYGSSSNTFYHNNIIDNAQQVVFSDVYANVWDDGYPSGGNYWSDYSGVDFYSGSFQNETGSDGIGDTSYVMNEDNQDHYPLMQPYVVPTHDIAVIDVTPSKTVVGQGYSLNITVTAANQGDFTETFNVTLYANTTSIATQTVTLTSGSSTTVTFTWNTTGFAKGNYTISAYAWPVVGENDLADNTLFDGFVLVSVPGDVDGSFRVDGGDLALLGLAWFSKPGDPNWNPNADINNGGLVDGGDLGILGFYWFQTDP
jgi:parallel beta-helix repeat protein